MPAPIACFERCLTSYTHSPAEAIGVADGCDVVLFVAAQKLTLGEASICRNRAQTLPSSAWP